MKALILSDGSWGGNYEEWEYETHPEWDLTDVLYNNQFDYYPKWDAINEEWYESATQYQMDEFNIKLATDNALLGTDKNSHRSANQRQPISDSVRRSVQRAYARERHDLLELDPNYVFPDYSKIPKLEWTYRQIVDSDGTSVVMDEFIDSETLTEVEIEDSKVYDFTWDFETQTLSGINVNNGDHLVIKF